MTRPDLSINEDFYLHTGFNRFSVIVAIMLLLCCSSRLDGSPLVRANSNANVGGFTDARSASSGSVSDEDSGSNEVGVAQSRSSASFGVLRAYGSSSAGPFGSSVYSIFSINNASWRDDWLFDAPGLTGTAGTIEVSFTIDGSISASRTGVSQSYSSDPSWAEAQYQFGADNFVGSGLRYERVYSDGTRTGQGAPFLGIRQTFTLGFTYGTPLTNVQLSITAATNTQGEYAHYYTSAIADMENTATWGGFSALRDSAGNLVNNYSFTSSSGTDFARAIPEPGSISLFFAAGITMAATRLRRCLPRLKQ